MKGTAMPITPWRATCIQMPSRVATGSASRADAWQIIRHNLETAERMIDEVLAAPETRDSRLLLLPEFGFQGPPLKENVQEWIDLAAATLPGAISHSLQAKARQYGVYIGANQFEYDPEWPGRHFNCSFLIDPNGEIILRYRRIYTAQWPSPHDMMDAYLDRYGVEGTFPVVDTELGRIAMFPCGEVSTPEAARMFMLRGAEILLHPDNGGTNPAGDAVMVARAYENMLYFVSTNVAGPIGFAQGGTPLGGHSMIVDFDGNVVASEMGTEPSTRATALLDVEQLRAARRDTTMRNRLLRSRFEIYRPVYEQAHFYPANSFAERPMADWRETMPVAEAALRNMIRHGVSVEAEELIRS
jgi:predicted amidohydrolase